MRRLNAKINKIKNMTLHNYPVAIIGAGPVGLAAAAHLANRNIPFILFESGNSVGTNLLEWGHVRVFSPWRYNIDPVAEKLLAEMKWRKPDEDGLPTGAELVKNYLLPLSFHPKIEHNLHLSSRILTITRKGIDKIRTTGREAVPFVLKVDQGGILKTFEASAVIDSSGIWQNPNPIGAGGVFADGELENSDRISYRIPDILGRDEARYANRTVVVVGAGHSAINSLLDLAALKKKYPATNMHWVLRRESLSSIYGGQKDDALEARGALGTRIEQLVNAGELQIHAPYFIDELVAENQTLTLRGYVKEDYKEIAGIEEIIANTGARPDLSILREVRVETDAALECVPELAELIDPNIHSCGTVRPHGELELRQPEPNFYVVGSKSYGRAPTFLMATGYEQVRSIAAWLDGDVSAARKVELNLPETGVCSVGGEAGSACCGAEPATAKSEINRSACCTPASNENLKVNPMENETKVNTVQGEVAGCCGGAPVANEDACCKLDEEKKAEGLSGCGCGVSTASSKATAASSCC